MDVCVYLFVFKKSSLYIDKSSQITVAVISECLILVLLFQALGIFAEGQEAENLESDQVSKTLLTSVFLIKKIRQGDIIKIFNNLYYS